MQSNLLVLALAATVCGCLASDPEPPASAVVTPPSSVAPTPNSSGPAALADSPASAEAGRSDRSVTNTPNAASGTSSPFVVTEATLVNPNDPAAALAARVARQHKPVAPRKRYGGLLHELWVARSRSSHPPAPPQGPEAPKAKSTPEEDNTVYDPITGRASGVCLFKIRFGH